MNQFNLYRLANMEADQMRMPMKRAALLLGFIKGPNVDAWVSDATARLKMAEPAELSHFEPSRAIKLAHNQNGLGSAHELAQPG